MKSYNYVKSNYYYSVNFYESETVYKNILSYSWNTGVKCNDKSHEIIHINSHNDSAMKKEIEKIFQGDLVNKIIRITDRYIKKIKSQYNIMVFYYIGIDLAKREYQDEKDIIEDEKKIIIYTIQYADADGVLLTSGYSNNYEKFDLNSIRDMFIQDQKKIMNIIKYNWIEKGHKIKKIIFSSFVSAIVTHELFGHLFERDNFEKYGVTKISKGFNVYDSPKEGLSGDCLYDDFGNILKSSIIVKNGKIENLIGNMDRDIPRFRDGNNKVLFRVTNTVVEPIETVTVQDYDGILQMESVSQAIIKNGILSLNIEASYIKINENLFRIPKFILNLPVKEVLQNIQCIKGRSTRISSVHCIKKNQRCGGIGSISPALKISLDNTYDIS